MRTDGVSSIPNPIFLASSFSFFRADFLIFCHFTFLMLFSEIKSILPQRGLSRVDDLPFPKIFSGKVRELFDLGDRYLIIATDRISAFDVILSNTIAGKGIMLTQLSLWWFRQTDSIIPNHLVPDHQESLARVLKDFPHLIPYSMLVWKFQPIRIEAIVRGYLSGSAWKFYSVYKNLWGIELPSNLIQDECLPFPLFTPSTKAEVGSKDSPLTRRQGRRFLGEELYNQIEKKSLEIYQLGAERSIKSSLILADTKLEFALDDSGTLFLVDEICKVRTCTWPDRS